MVTELVNEAVIIAKHMKFSSIEKDMGDGWQVSIQKIGDDLQIVVTRNGDLKRVEIVKA